MDDDLDTPNCPQDLIPLEAVGQGRAIIWKCPECGLVQLY